MRRSQLHLLQTISIHTRTLTTSAARLSSQHLPGTLAHTVPTMAPLNPASLVCTMCNISMSVPGPRAKDASYQPATPSFRPFVDWTRCR